MVSVGGDGLLGEEVTLEANRTLAQYDGERIRERQQDEVPLAVGPLEERTAVVDVHVDPVVGVRLARVVGPGQVQDDRVDLDGVDPFGAVAEGDRHVVAGACADDEHVAHLFRGPEVVDEVVHGRLVLRVLVPGGDVVDAHDDPAFVVLVPREGVVRRPGLRAAERLDPQHGHQQEQGCRPPSTS